MLKGAIFDVDGTLLDSMSIWENLGKDYLRSLGVVPRDDLRDALRPLSCGQTAKYLKTEYCLSLSEDEITKSITRMIADFYINSAKLKPGIKELIDKLKNKNIILCIATASDEELVKSALKREGILHCFDRIFTCEAVGKSKSYPDVFEAALLHIGCGKDECIVFEDSYHAICTARSAGFTVAGIYDKYEPRWEKAKHECDFWFDTVEPPYPFEY